MASSEQPLKKRKLYDSAPLEPQGPPNPGPNNAPPPPPPSQEEILRKRKNRDEIRNLYEFYRRMKYCVSQKNPRLMPDFEQAYLSLISASRGCTSVQRIVAELIPRYASYCPTALEAAAKVSINMYNWSLAIIIRGEDVDGVAYQTAKACIFGLVDICSTASHEAPTSSVIQGICSAVFLNVLTFFTSSFEEKDIFEIGGKQLMKLQESMESFSDLKQEPADDVELASYKLFKFRALSLLYIFFSYPRNLLEACFELLVSDGVDGLAKGRYFLTQVTTFFSVGDPALDEIKDEISPCKDSSQACTHVKETNEVAHVSNDGTVLEKSLSKISFMGMAIGKDISLRGWIQARFKKLSDSLTSKAYPELASFLEKIFNPILEASERSELNDHREDNVDPSKFNNHRYLADKIPVQYGIAAEKPDASSTDMHCEDKSATREVAGQMTEPARLRFPVASNLQPVKKVQSYLTERSMSAKSLEMGDLEDSSLERNSNEDSLSRQHLSAISSKQSDYENDDPHNKVHGGEAAKDQVLNIDNELLVNTSVSGVAPNILPSPKPNAATQYFVSPSQVHWYSDGDPAAMDVFSASKMLWLGSLGHDASESVVRMQFEDFGPIEQFLFFSSKDFALIEYRNIMDAVKAREYMQGSSLWGGCLCIKFLDTGFGSRGAINGVAIGESCHVYTGRVPSKQAKDDIFNELMAARLSNPRMVTDLTSENALLLEYCSSEEATISMSHIRMCRKETRRNVLSNKSLMISTVKGERPASGCQLMVSQIDASASDEELINAFSRFGELTGWQFMRQNGCCLINFQSCESANAAKSHLDGARFGLMSIEVEIRSDHPAHGNILSHVQTSHESPADSCRKRISQLSSLFSSLCMKYKIDQSSSSHACQKLKDYYAINARDEDSIPINTVWIGLPAMPSPFLTDDELMSICKLAINSLGSVVRIVRLKRENMQNSCWLVEFNSVEAAATALKNIRDCPGVFLQIEFRNPKVSSYHDELQFAPYLPSHGPAFLESKPGNQYHSSYSDKPNIVTHELVSPRTDTEKFGGQVHNRPPYGSNWSAAGSAEMMEARPSFSEAPGTSHGGEHSWQYKKLETEPPVSGAGRLPCPPPVTYGGSMIPPPMPPFSYPRPFYPTQNSSWDNYHQNHPPPVSQISHGMMGSDNYHVNVPGMPFVPSSINAVSQLSENSGQRYDQKVPNRPNPPPPDVLPPLPSPPPLPLSQPPSIPPPPRFSPHNPQSALESFNTRASEQNTHYQWQGSLSKSGVHYCTIYAVREDSNICKYTVAAAEPVNWPARLDVTKRAVFHHVKTIFANTPSHKREVCRLLPSAMSDHKGLHDFITYLRQRDCAGVIKIPAVNFMWTRVLFILPHSPETCSMLAIPLNPVDCLLAFVLPKEE
ncbi:activating signal cointegrator complex subunit 2 protein [Dioscorea alata]|uniref:Activating signal cointegrator complex subunit 2 protein n=1 Tax=Dioscorea alata TaxID=55571 RepID=A0ACB7UJY4_DIOAL|nr:activating signal cointegrator complex subunit 2 protein [Dioscorea alata]